MNDEAQERLLTTLETIHDRWAGIENDLAALGPLLLSQLLVIGDKLFLWRGANLSCSLAHSDRIAYYVFAELVGNYSVAVWTTKLWGSSG